MEVMPLTYVPARGYWNHDA